MLKCFVIVVLWTTVLQKAGQSNAQTYDDLFTTVKSLTKENAEVGRIPQVDSLGTFLALIDRILTQAARGRPPPMGDSCNTRLVQLGENEVKISQQPRGVCSYCCRLIKPAKYLRIYFTSKAKDGNTVELKITKKTGALRAAGVNSSLPTVVFIHGFTEHGLGPCPRIIKNAYLSIDQDYNILLVDWGDLTPFPWYPQAAQNAKFIGVVLAKFMNFYNSTGELPISNIHLVGFSLGAHIAGFIGKYFQSHQKIPRITALDPALPLYPLNDTSQRLVKTDAEFVDVIHTNAGMLGFPTSIGHADFYPNRGGLVQPGCDAGTLAEQNMMDEYVWCSHVRAWRLYAESVRNPKAFPATKCGILREGSFKECSFTTDGYMGFGASKKTVGDFYLTTTDRTPFAKSAKDQEADMKTINLIL